MTALSAWRLVALLLLVQGCTHAERPGDVLRVTSPPPPGKPTAPVTVDFEVTTRRAVVTVTSSRDAEGLRVDVTGTDGLELTPGVVPPRAVKAGEPVSLTVPVSVPRGVLVVAVEGTFSGARLVRVASLEVGRPRPAAGSGPQVIDTESGPVKVVPVEP